MKQPQHKVQKNQKTYPVKNAGRPKKKGQLVFAAFLLIAVVSAALFALKKDTTGEATPQKISGQPALEVDRQAVDLGDVKLGQPVEVSFEVTNAGGQPLVFTEEPYIEVKEGC